MPRSLVYTLAILAHTGVSMFILRLLASTGHVWGAVSYAVAFGLTIIIIIAYAETENRYEQPEKAEVEETAEAEK
jgi:predicted tellurium resistance membrane protein TerC